ncbi:DUF3618 domain-containing protein [Croceicoccus marinus]|uniref:DUF3618 domain-containing protein n=1 Tax=Croceicoccus marinus TaxID=450378 RepID=A0A1Z1FG21_9SPHN|nr:DUF3618 domain-containing protein [Croceicoccus marinus]ARU17744.1 hypothetical protein A9D14_15360 [Croceicoccus marinus]QNE07211.1 DUF3618 domain-containing protein [Croceicoccus marinus]
MTDTDTRDPDEIEREIRQTQREMSRTVDTIGEQFTPRSLLNALLDKAEENDVDARAILDGARRNPIALGLIAAGGIWLISDSDAKLSTFKSSDDDAMTGDSWIDGPEHLHHRGYVDHMARIEPRADEDDLAYRRRRDDARASYLMIERGHDEEESGFRKRLDEATEQMRQRRDHLAQQASSLGRKSRERGGRAAEKVQGAYYDNPILGGLAAAFVGAIAGAAIPATRTEEEQLGSLGAKALNEAEGHAEHLAEKARAKKDEVVSKAENKMAADEKSTSASTSAG